MKPRLLIFTLVLDGLPWITHHLPVFNRIDLDWRWVIVHGVAANVRDTAWIRPQDPRLSNDGTTEYLRSIVSHPRVTVLEQPIWDGKTAMCNAALRHAQAPCVILEVDADEIWTAEQITAIATIFEANEALDRIQFPCKYYLGPNIVITSLDGKSYGCRYNEWSRAWRMRHPVQRFIKHEPPTFQDCNGLLMARDEAKGYGLEFDHFAYATEAQVAYKETVYNYPHAVDGWKRLQANRTWPTKVKPFLPWVDDVTTADLLVR